MEQNRTKRIKTRAENEVNRAGKQQHRRERGLIIIH